MRIGLFIPCYIDAFFPEVGIATLELLERFGHEVDLSARPDLLRPADGEQRVQRRMRRHRGAVRAQLLRLRLRRGAVRQLRPPRAGQFRRHRADRRGQGGSRANLRAGRVPARHPEGRCVSLGQISRIGSACTTAAAPCASSSMRARPSCTSRSSPSPWTCSPRSRGSSSSQPARPDECCGFGGTFSVFEEVVSTKMGYDKVSDHARAGAEYIVSADSSCLMHQQGCAERIGVPMKFIHIAQILNGASA